MDINSKTIVSMTEANQNFSRVARIAETYGEVVIFKNNKPKYRLIDIEQAKDVELTDDEKIDIIAHRILEKYRPAFEALAKEEGKPLYIELPSSFLLPFSPEQLPRTEIQNCIIHQLRNSSKYVSYKDLKALMADRKAVMQL